MSWPSGGFFSSHPTAGSRSQHRLEQSHHQDVRPGHHTGSDGLSNQSNGPGAHFDRNFGNVPRGPRNGGQPSTYSYQNQNRFQGPPPTRPPFNQQQPNSNHAQHIHPPQQTTTSSSQESTVRPSPSYSLPMNNKGWTSNTVSNYNDIYGLDDPSSIRKTRNPRGTNRQGGPSEASGGIKGRKFGYALIGKEAEQYVTEDLRDQLVSSIPPIASEPAVPSPLSSSGLTPRMIVDEFRVAGHLQITQKELQKYFHANCKEQFLKPLEAILLHYIKDMTPEARKKLASQDERVQETGLKGWLDDSGDVADVIDDFLERLREQPSEGDGLFASKGAIGRNIGSRLDEVIKAEKRRLEHRKGDSSDEEGGDSTPLNKGSTASGGSQTPMTST